MKKISKDLQLKEFEAKDLGEDLRRSGSAVKVSRSQPTSILLPRFLLKKLKEKAAKKGVGYQTLLKIIVCEHVDQY